MRKSRPIQSRPASLAKQEERLQKRHVQLKSQVRAMEERHLDGRSQSHMVELKKEKLAVKDALLAIQQD